jgi:hypothetical protein
LILGNPEEDIDGGQVGNLPHLAAN